MSPVEQGFPVRLALALAAQKRQQVTGAFAAHSIGHQHLHPLAPAGRRTRRLTPSKNK